jgi:hypothetical protein
MIQFVAHLLANWMREHWGRHSSLPHAIHNESISSSSHVYLQGSQGNIARWQAKVHLRRFRTPSGSTLIAQEEGTLSGGTSLAVTFIVIAVAELRRSLPLSTDGGVWTAIQSLMATQQQQEGLHPFRHHGNSSSSPTCGRSQQQHREWVFFSVDSVVEAFGTGTTPVAARHADPVAMSALRNLLLDGSPGLAEAVRYAAVAWVHAAAKPSVQVAMGPPEFSGRAIRMIQSRGPPKPGCMDGHARFI